MSHAKTTEEMTAKSQREKPDTLENARATGSPHVGMRTSKTLELSVIRVIDFQGVWQLCAGLHFDHSFSVEA